MIRVTAHIEGGSIDQARSLVEKLCFLMIYSDYSVVVVVARNGQIIRVS